MIGEKPNRSLGSSTLSHRTAPGFRPWAAVAVLALMLPLLAMTRAAWGVELCSREGDDFMLKVGISRERIDRVCALVRLTAAPLTITLQRTEEELGYCRVTLALQNRSTEYLNQLALTTAKGRFEIFKFHNILPGTTGYASAKSRILLGCDEVAEMKIRFHWPPSMRIADRALQGRRLDNFKPVLIGEILLWQR